MDQKGKVELDHRSIQLNKNSDAFWQSRGLPQRPADWKSAPTKVVLPVQKHGSNKKP